MFTQARLHAGADDYMRFRKVGKMEALRAMASCEPWRSLLRPGSYTDSAGALAKQYDAALPELVLLVQKHNAMLWLDANPGITIDEASELAGIGSVKPKDHSKAPQLPLNARRVRRPAKR